VPQGSQPGLWGSWGVAAGGFRSDSTQRACPGGLAARPQDATRAGPGRWQQEGSALGHPSAKGPCSMGMRTTVHMWLCCVLKAQAGPTAGSQEQAGVPLPRCTAGTRAPCCGAAQPSVQWGFGSGAAGQADGQLEWLVRRRWRGWEERLWELLLCPTGLSAQPVCLLGTTGFLETPCPWAAARLSPLNQHVLPSQLFPSRSSTTPSTTARALGPTEPQGKRGCSEPGQGGIPGWAPPAPLLPHVSVAERDRGAPCATTHLRPGHTAGVVSKDILTG